MSNHQLSSSAACQANTSESDQVKNKRACLPLSKEKLHTLHGNHLAPNSYHRHKELLQLRKQQEEDDRAKIFSEFVSDFNDSGASSNPHDRTFLRSSRPSHLPHYRQGDHVPPTDRIFRPLAPQTTGLSEPQPVYQPEAPMISNPLRKRKLDELVDSFKLQSELDSNACTPNSSSTSNLGILHLPFSSVSTNVFVGNLNPVVTEDVLCALFSKFGPIASVKIMWPRTKEEASRGHHSGFVCFMDRPSAQRAFSAMQAQNLQGFPMRLDWGKPVTLPSKPSYVSEEWRTSIHSSSQNGQSILVEVPDDPLVRVLIHQTIERVLQWGRVFEEIILTKNAENPTFQFLTDPYHPYHHYYQWRLYSLMQGDSTERWRTKPFQMISDGPVWIPPPCIASLDDEDSMNVDVPDSDSDLKDRDVHGKSVSLAFVRRLRALCMKTLDVQDAPTRGVVARIMALVIIASEAAADISRELTRLLVRRNGGPEWQLRMLWVIHEVLVNSTAPVTNAWRYRDTLASELPAVFDHLGQTYLTLRREASDRWAADVWRTKVLAIVSSWRAGMIFPRPFVTELELLLKPSGPPVLEALVKQDILGNDPALEVELKRQEPVKLAGTAVNWVPVSSSFTHPVTSTATPVQHKPTAALHRPKVLAFNLSKPIARRP